MHTHTYTYIYIRVCILQRRNFCFPILSSNLLVGSFSECRVCATSSRPTIFVTPRVVCAKEQSGFASSNDPALVRAREMDPIKLSRFSRTSSPLESEKTFRRDAKAESTLETRCAANLKPKRIASQPLATRYSAAVAIGDRLP